MSDLVVLIGGERLTRIQSFSLLRSTESITGEVSISIFMSYIPEERVFNGVIREAETLVYIGGHLAFTGALDSRRDSGTPPGQYNIELTARGRTKRLIDYSHRHPTGTILRTTNRQVFEALVQPFSIRIEWLAEEVSLPRVRLRDGAKVYDELRRIAQRTGVNFYETRDGNLRVVDTPTGETGEPIVLTQNIVSFDADLRGELEKRNIQVKGQRTEPTSWGAQAIAPSILSLQDSTVPEGGQLTVQMYGTATPDALRRAGGYDYNRRVAAARDVNVQLFGNLQSAGSPWDLGLQHQVEIPPAGVSGFFEAASLNYVLDAAARVRTNLSLHPLTTRAEGESLLDATSASSNSGEWVPAAISQKPDLQSEIPEVVASLLDDVGDSGTPPLTLEVI